MNAKVILFIMFTGLQQHKTMGLCSWERNNDVVLIDEDPRVFTTYFDHEQKERRCFPEYVVNASTLQSFQHHLKTFLFQRSFPDILL